jgi:hypothetical protein
MGFPDIFWLLGNASTGRTVPFRLFINLCVDAAGTRAYIGGGPHLPNEVLSFWKE